MRRREFITLLGGAAAAWPVAARAQKPGKLFRIGYLNAAIPGVLPVEQRAIAAFIMGLAERGLVQDRDFVIEYRYGDNRPDRLVEVAARPTPRFRTIQVYPKDLRSLPGHAERAVSWPGGFRGGAQCST